MSEILESFPITSVREVDYFDFVDMIHKQALRAWDEDEFEGQIICPPYGLMSEFRIGRRGTFDLIDHRDLGYSALTSATVMGTY